jgi:hypothetical protein
MNQNSTLLCPFGIGYVQFMPHEVEDISEFYRVGSISFDKRLVRFEDCTLLFLVIHLFLDRLAKFQIFRLALLLRGGTLHMEELI